MSESPNQQPTVVPCIECHAGILQLRHITYFTWLDAELVMVPDFPAWVCDVCGRREFDEKAIQWLNMLLDPNAGKPTRANRRTPPLPRRQTGVQRPVSES